jgi:hypothetical protein
MGRSQVQRADPYPDEIAGFVLHTDQGKSVMGVADVKSA